MIIEYRQSQSLIPNVPFRSGISGKILISI